MVMEAITHDHSISISIKVVMIRGQGILHHESSQVNITHVTHLTWIYIQIYIRLSHLRRIKHMEHVMYGYGNLSIIYNNHGNLQIFTTFTYTAHLPAILGFTIVHCSQ